MARVHAYGRGEDLRKPAVRGQESPASRCVYAILDYISGHSLDLSAFFKDTRERRTHLYAQIIDVLAQLRGLEFPVSGSLYPRASGRNDDDDGEPTVGGLLCIEHNELRKMTRWTSALRPATFHSAADFALYQYRLMREAYQVPIGRWSEAYAQMEEYALHHVKADILDALVESSTGPDGGSDECFVLSHTDLRWYNILVDDDLNIQGVIDWEWAGAIPRALFMPPTWLVGRSPCYISSKADRKEYAELFAVLTSMASAVAEAEAATY